MAMRAAVRALRDGSAPAAILRRRGRAAAPSKSLGGVRSMSNAAVPCSSCQIQLLKLRKEMVAENDRVWRMYEGMLDVNQLLLKKMCEIESEAAKRQAVAVETMVNTSYRILSTGAFFMAGAFMGISPALKAAWQEDTIKVLEQRLDEEDAARNGEMESPAGQFPVASGAME